MNNIILSSDFGAKTTECLHFEHSSLFDYSVINVVHYSDSNANGRGWE